MNSHMNGDGSRGRKSSRFYSSHGIEFIPPTPSGIEVVTFSNLEVNRHGRTSWAEAMPNCPPHATYPEREKYEGKSSSWGTDSEHDGQMLGSHGRQQAERRICGLSHRTALIITAVALVIVIGAVGGGVGVMMATRRGRTAQGQTSAPSPTPSPKIKSSPVLQNSSLAALQWTDSVGSTVVDHYHVYYQLTDGTIAESAWDSDTATWTVSRITDPSTDVALGTPLSAAAGYPHVNTSLGIVKNVYFKGKTGTIFERQSPFKGQTGVWGNDNFSGLYSASSASLLASYWRQDLVNGTQDLAVFFQEIGANSLTTARYRGNRTADLDWAAVRHSILVADGSPFVLAPTGLDGGAGLELYLSDGVGMLAQHAFRLDVDGVSALGDAKRTSFQLTKNQPVTVAAAVDNTGLFSSAATVPECTKTTSRLTHLILLPNTPDQQVPNSLSLISWNCSAGFSPVRDTDVAPVLTSLLRNDGGVPEGGSQRTFIALAAAATAVTPPQTQVLQKTSGRATSGRVFVMYDAGDGPQIDEWTVPATGSAGPGTRSWALIGEVPVRP